MPSQYKMDLFSPNRAFLAIDQSDFETALSLVEKTSVHLGGIKLGLEFYTRFGPDGVKRMLDFGKPVFLDLKLHDIPNTVASAIKTLRGLPVDFLTVHASGGSHMLKAAREAAGELDHPLALLGVTVLTSLADEDLKELGFEDGTKALTRRLASLAIHSGLDGLITSPLEIEVLRQDLGDDPLLVVPGIRLDTGMDDQKRVATPHQALAAGASALVIGRAVTASKDPKSAAIRIQEELEKVS